MSYYGQPIVKAPVWTWQIGLYLFVGGTAGMSGVLALAGFLAGQSHDFLRAALGVSVGGAVISPILLIWDLGRPARFLNMLRVFKWRSAMSVGVWTLVVFSNLAVGALAAVIFAPDSRGLTAVLVLGTALTGVVLATYTGVLLGATAVPSWNAHHKLLPFHFGSVALGSAAMILELLGFRLAALNAIALTVTVVETGLGIWLQFRRGGSQSLLLRAAALLTGPVPLVARLAGWIPAAGICFLVGAVCSRYGWLFTGRQTARTP
jgi:DMSO reductase anchor subunit